MDRLPVSTVTAMPPEASEQVNCFFGFLIYIYIFIHQSFKPLAVLLTEANEGKGAFVYSCLCLFSMQNSQSKGDRLSRLNIIWL